MKIIVSGKEYEAVNIAKVTLLDQLELKRVCKVSLFDIEKNLENLARLSDEDEAMAAIGDEEVLRALVAFVWLTRRRAGEFVTFDEAADFPMAELEWVPDEDEAAEVDPTLPAPTDS